jgi:hypothetical protein
VCHEQPDNDRQLLIKRRDEKKRDGSALLFRVKHNRRLKIGPGVHTSSEKNDIRPSYIGTSGIEVLDVGGVSNSIDEAHTKKNSVELT